MVHIWQIIQPAIGYDCNVPEYMNMHKIQNINLSPSYTDGLKPLFRHVASDETLIALNLHNSSVLCELNYKLHQPKYAVKRYYNVFIIVWFCHSL